MWVTYKAEEFWKKNPARHVSWRYIGTKAGFIRIFPGVSLQKSYEHEKRAWWRQALTHKGKIVITTPYVDAWGSGIVLTLIHTIYKKGSTTVTATVAADFPLEYFNWFLNDVYPECKIPDNRCMIVDDSGFIVMHPKLKETKSEDDFNEPKHITVEEPEIANLMISTLVLIENECQDMSENKNLKSFRVSMRNNKPNGLDFSDTNEKFELRPITNTNIFIIYAKRFTETECKCDATKSPDAVTCDNSCKCLCHTPITYDVCSNRYNRSVNLPCSPRLPDTSGESEPDVTSDLKPCFTSTCQTKQSKTNCFSEAECSWCEYTNVEKFIDTPCCRLKEECTFGKAKAEFSNTCAAPTSDAPKANEEVLSETGKYGVIVGASIAAGIILTLIVIGGIFYLRGKKKNVKEEVYLSAIPEDELKDYGHCNKDFQPPGDALNELSSHQRAGEPNQYFDPNLQSSS